MNRNGVAEAVEANRASATCARRSYKPAGSGKPTVENGTALRPRDKLLAGHAVDLRRWRVLWLPRNTSSIIAKDKPKHADFEAYERSSGRPIDDERGRDCTLQRDCV